MRGHPEIGAFETTTSTRATENGRDHNDRPKAPGARMRRRSCMDRRRNARLPPRNEPGAVGRRPAGVSRTGRFLRGSWPGLLPRASPRAGVRGMGTVTATSEQYCKAAKFTLAHWFRESGE